MRLIFIRHGDPDYVNDSLTEKGVREAKLLAQRVAGWKDIDEFFVSPLGRAAETASYSLEALGREGTTCDWLREFAYRVDDPITGRLHVPWDFMPSYWTVQDDMSDRDKWIDNALLNSNPEFKDRYEEVREGIDSILAKYGYIRDGRIYRTDHKTDTWGPGLERPEQDHTLCFFCHFGVTGYIAGHLLGISPMQILHGFFMPPTSLTILASEERIPGEVAFRAQVFGDTAHLLGKEPVSPAGYFTNIFSE